MVGSQTINNILRLARLGEHPLLLWITRFQYFNYVYLDSYEDV